nr:unnamed protein product [Spirometra erinaceieuropaei]
MLATSSSDYFYGNFPNSKYCSVAPDTSEAYSTTPPSSPTPQVETTVDLHLPLSLSETIKAVQQLCSGKASGSDAIPTEIYMHDGSHLMDPLTALFQGTNGRTRKVPIVVSPSTSPSPPTPSTKVDRSSEPPIPSFSSSSDSPASAVVASAIHVNTTHPPDTPTNANTTTVNNADLESVLLASALPEDRRAEIRSCATGILRQKRRQQILPTDEAQGLQSLKSDHNIVVVPADKAGAAVIMGRIDYVNKANGIFSGIAAYTLLAEDPTKKQAAAIKKKVNDFTRLNFISAEDSKLVNLSDPHIARAYGLPKVRKVDVPLRIIVPIIGSPTYNIVKWLYNHLKRLSHGSDYSINNFQEFLQRTQGLEERADECPLSFDVVALFSFIPHDLAIECVVQRLQENPVEIPNQHIIELLKLYWQFDKQHGSESLNRAKLFNVAVREIRQSGFDDQLHGIDCFLLHDVDKLPASPTAVYECGQNVKQLATTFRSPDKIKRHYDEFVGVATAFRWEHVEKINGASNMFYGWGGEDDLWYRLWSNGITVDRPSGNDGVFDDFGRANTLDITSEALELLRAGNITARWKNDGINQTRYKLLARHDYNFFIWLLVSI